MLEQFREQFKEKIGGADVPSPVSKGWATPTRLIVVSFAAVILTGTVVLMLPVSTVDGVSPRLIDAFFTSTSAVCVTGLVVVNTASYWSVFGQAVIVLLIQVGGLGLMTFATAQLLVTGRRIGLKQRLIIQEQTGQWSLSGLVILLRRLLVATFVFEAAGAVILGAEIGRARNLPFLQAAFHGVFHSVSAFCNAGFDILGNSLVGFTGNVPVTLTVSFLIIFGGIGFHVIVDLYNHKAKWSELNLHSRIALKATACLLIFGTLAFGIFEWGNPGTLGDLSLKDKILAAWFQSVTPRTAGFNSIAIERLLPASAFLTVLLMFIGASPGGTGGGVKTTTFAIAARFVTSTINGREDVVFERRRLPMDTVIRAIAIVLISMSLVLVSVLALTVTEDASFMDILFEAVSAFGTVGLSRGITPSLTVLGKLVIIGTMFAGRVGPLSLLIALTAPRSGGNIRYPEEKVTVG